MKRIAINPMFPLASLLVALFSGCATHQAAGRWVSLGFPYYSEVKQLSTRGSFFWFLLQDRKTIAYEPCVGTYKIDLLAETKSQLIFQVIQNTGIAIDLRSGLRVNPIDVVGTSYKAKISGSRILSVSSRRSTVWKLPV